MSTVPKASNAVETASISGRAAQFLSINHAGPHATKRIARDFGVSAAMAKLLRAGHCWTVARLDQARRLYGRAFDDFIFLPSADAIHNRLDRIECQLAEIRRDLSGEK